MIQFVYITVSFLVLLAAAWLDLVSMDAFAVGASAAVVALFLVGARALCK